MRLPVVALMIGVVGFACSHHPSQAEQQRKAYSQTYRQSIEALHASMEAGALITCALQSPSRAEYAICETRVKNGGKP